jgi:hypothetical protein
MVQNRIIGHPLCAGYHRKLISGSLSSYPKILDYNVSNFECRAFKLISQNLKWSKIRFVTFVLGVSFIDHLCSFMSSQIFPVIVLLLVLNPLTFRFIYTYDLDMRLFEFTSDRVSRNAPRNLKTKLKVWMAHKSFLNGWGESLVFKVVIHWVFPSLKGSFTLVKSRDCLR